jgi:hypothetical protein
MCQHNFAPCCAPVIGSLASRYYRDGRVGIERAGSFALVAVPAEQALTKLGPGPLYSLPSGNAAVKYQKSLRGYPKSKDHASSVEIHRPIPRLYMRIGAGSSPHSYGQNRPKGQVPRLSPHVVHRRALNATSVLYVVYRELPASWRTAASSYFKFDQIGYRARFSSGKKSAGDRGIRVARGGGSIGVFGYSCPHGGKLGDNFNFSLRQA